MDSLTSPKQDIKVNAMSNGEFNQVRISVFDIDICDFILAANEQQETTHSIRYSDKEIGQRIINGLVDSLKKIKEEPKRSFT